MASTLLSGMHPSSGTARVKLTKTKIYYLWWTEEIWQVYCVASKKMLASFWNISAALGHQYWPGLVDQILNIFEFALMRHANVSCVVWSVTTNWFNICAGLLIHTGDSPRWVHCVPLLISRPCKHSCGFTRSQNVTSAIADPVNSQDLLVRHWNQTVYVLLTPLSIG